MNDFRVTIDETRCGVRATALIVRNQHLFVTRDARGVYYTIGGAVAVNESSEVAVMREIEEEIGGSVKHTNLAFIVENFFEHEGQKYHNIEFHYLVELMEEPLMEMEENGAIQPCEWIAFDCLAEIDLRPRFLKERLPKWQQLEHIINKGA